jgi:hypothetical protein
MKNNIVAECQYCHKSFPTSTSEQRRGYGKYCSRSCGLRGRDQSGDNNPNWKGGVSTDNYRYKLRQLKKHPQEMKARQVAYHAKRRGKILPQPCYICNSPTAEMHHSDYSKPLEITWLCRDHHRELHQANSPCPSATGNSRADFDRNGAV